MEVVTIEGRWTRNAGTLKYIVPSAERPGFSRWLALLSLAIAALGILIMVMAGAQMLDGDFTSTGTSRKSGWMTPPIAFALGALLSLSPIAIWLQVKRFRPHADDGRVAVVTLRPEAMSLADWPGHARRAWDDITDAMVAEVPEQARAVVQHYRDHPEDRAEIGTRSSLVRASGTSS